MSRPPLVRDWRLAKWDPAGIFLPDRDDWYVRATRKVGYRSDAFTRRLRQLGGLRPGVEVRTFEHWAIGRIEVLITAGPGRPS